MKVAVNGKSLLVDSPGGAVLVARRIVCALAETTNWSIDVLTPNEDKNNIEVSLPDSINIVRLPAISADSTWAKAVWEQWTLPRYVKKKNYDVLVNLTNSAPVFFGFNIAQILLIHDSGFLSKKWFSTFYSMYIRVVIRQACAKRIRLATVSSSSAKEIRLAFPGMDEITVVHNGFDAPPEDIQDFAPGYPYILFLGSINPRKNLVGLVKSFRRFKEKFPDSALKLVIAGGVKSVFRQDGVELSGPDIEILGYVSDRMKWGLMRGAYVLALPSHMEGFGMPIGEALMTGTPVLASDIAVFRELYGEKISYADISSDVGLFESLVYLYEQNLTRPDEETERSWILGKYSWPSAGQQYRDLCLEAVDSIK